MKKLSLLLLCSVFPQDCEIPIELLTRCAIGLGVVGEVRSYEEARNDVIAAKIKLMSCCLLLDAGCECVKMHDLVRDVAHLIAKNENKLIKCEVENDVTLEQNSVRYLWCEKLPNDLDCSNLEFLGISTEVEVLDEIFTRMGKLRVLCLANQRYNRLPLSTMSFKTLTNLRCLILLRWKLSDISFVRYMKKLESLSLENCSLPSFIDLQKDDAVSHMTKLKLLVLHGCKMERNIFEVIGRIPQLEELCIVDKSEEWDDYSENTIELYKAFSVPQTLQRFTIVFGSRWHYGGRDFLTPNERTLALRCFDISNEAIKGLANKAKNLYMGNMKGGAKNIIPNIFELEGGGMPELNELEIWNSKEIECLVDSSNHRSEVVGSLFSSLEILYLWGMDDLRVLWHGGLPPSGTFGELRILYLRYCPKLRSLLTQAITPNPVRYTIFQNLQRVRIQGLHQLKYVFSANTVGGLPQLETLEIWFCDELEEIVEDIIPSVANELEMSEENSSTPSAPLVNHSPGSFTLSKLTNLELLSCPKLGSLFMAFTAKTLISLEKLKINKCHGLKHLLTCERDHNKKQNSVEDDHDVQSVISMFLSLKSLFIDRCDLLQHIFPVFHVGGQNNIEHNSFTLQHLTTLEIMRCAKLEVIFPMYVVRCLPDNSICFPKLTVVIVGQCHKLKRLFSASASDDLPNLEVLVIYGANELEELIGCEQTEDEEIGKAKVELPKLKLLIFMHLSNLCQGIELRGVKHCIINNCPKLSLTSTTTLQELSRNIHDSDFENIGLSTWELKRLIDKINKSNEVLTSSSTSEFPSSQINEELEKEFFGEVHGSEVHDTAATSTYSELDGRLSPSPLDIHQRETNIEELVNGQSTSGSYLKDQQKQLGETESNIAIPQNIKIGVEEGTASENAMMVSSHLESTSSQPDSSQHKSYARQEWDSKPQSTSPLQMNQEDPSTSKSKSPSSQVNDNNQSIPGSIAEMVHEHKQIQNEAPVSETISWPNMTEISHDSTAEVTSSLKSPTIPVSANDVEIVEPSIDAQASKDNLSMLEDIGESHPSEEVVEETAMKQDPKNDESETSRNPSANPFVSPTPEEDREGPTYTTPDDSDDEFEEDFKAFDILTEWEQDLTPRQSTVNKPDQRAECEIFRTSFREKAFNLDILTIASDENLKVEVEEAAAKLLSFEGLVPEKERVRIQMFLDLLDEVVSKVKLQKNQQIQIDNIKNTSLDQRNQIEFAKQQANTCKLSFQENKSELVKLHASEKVLIEKIAALQLELSSVQIEKQTLESRQNDLRQTIKSSAAHAKSVAEQLKAQLENKLQLETSQVELVESLKSLKKKQKTQGQNYFM